MGVLIIRIGFGTLGPYSRFGTVVVVHAVSGTWSMSKASRFERNLAAPKPKSLSTPELKPKPKAQQP